ncbi:MAG: tetratricopeptide repeat protein [Methylococcales bacterium]
MIILPAARKLAEYVLFGNSNPALIALRCDNYKPAVCAPKNFFVEFACLLCSRQFHIIIKMVLTDIRDWVVKINTPMKTPYLFFLIFLVISLGSGCGLVATPEQEPGALSTDDSSTDQMSQAQLQKSPASILDANGDILFFAGDYDNALVAYQQALKLRETTLGVDHLELIQNLYNLATTCEAKNEYISAVKLYKHSQKIAIQHLGQNHPDTRAIQGFISAIFDARKLIGHSKTDAYQHVSLYKRIGTRQHPLLGVALRKLANLYMQEKNYKRAEMYFQESIEAVEKSIGVEHPYLALILQDYSFLLRQLDRIEEADLYEKRADSINIKFPKKQQTEFYRKRSRI